MGLLVQMLACGALAAPARGQASPRGPALNWVRLDGAEVCDGPVAMAERVELRLGQRVFVATPDAVLVVEGRVAPGADGGFVTQLRISSPEGEIFGQRELEVPAGHTCEELDALSALVIAITLRGEAGAGIPLPPDVGALLDRLFEPAPEDLPVTPSPAAAAEQAAREPEPTAPASPSESVAASETPPASSAPERGRAPLGASLAVLAEAASGLQPKGALGPALSLRLAWPRRLSLIARVGVALPATQGVAGSSGELRYYTWSWQVAMCGPELALRRSEVALCVRGGPLWLTAAARGFDAQNDTVRPLFGEVGPQARLRLPLAERLTLVMGLTVPVRIAPPTLRYVRSGGEAAVAWRVDRAGVSGELGLGVELR